MDRMRDSGSLGYGSIPYGRTKKEVNIYTEIHLYN